MYSISIMYKDGAALQYYADKINYITLEAYDYFSFKIKTEEYFIKNYEIISIKIKEINNG